MRGKVIEGKCTPTKTFNWSNYYSGITFHSDTEYDFSVNEGKYIVYPGETGYIVLEWDEFKLLFKIVSFNSVQRYALLALGHIYVFETERISPLPMKVVGFYDTEEEAEKESKTYSYGDFIWPYIYRIPKRIEKRLRKKLKSSEISNSDCAEFIWHNCIHN